MDYLYIYLFQGKSCFYRFCSKIWVWYDAYKYDGEREELKEQFTQI